MVTFIRSKWVLHRRISIERKLVAVPSMVTDHTLNPWFAAKFKQELIIWDLGLAAILSIKKYPTGVFHGDFNPASMKTNASEHIISVSSGTKLLKLTHPTNIPEIVSNVYCFLIDMPSIIKQQSVMSGFAVICLCRSSKNFKMQFIV